MIVTRTLPDGTVCDIKEYCETIYATVAVWETKKFNSGIAVSPNPTSGLTIVTFPDDFNIKNGHLRLTSITGATLYLEPINSNEIHLDLQVLPAGMYFLLCFSEQGFMIEKPIKLVKQ
jgi:hypothetical protein